MKNCKKTIDLICKKCESKYIVFITEYKYEKNEYKKYCSRKCANSKNWSDEHKKKLSESCKKSEKVKEANIRIGNEKKLKPKQIKEFTCLYCGKNGVSLRNGTKKQMYHKECWLKASGGIRKGSSRGKSGWYKGYWCDSSYELAFLIYNLEHNIKIERNNKGYEYFYKNEKHIFYPDFRIENELIEIKNFRSELTDIKLKSVDEIIKVYYKDTIKPYIEYVKSKYGKKFIEMYEK